MELFFVKDVKNGAILSIYHKGQFLLKTMHNIFDPFIFFGI